MPRIAFFDSLRGGSTSQGQAELARNSSVTGPTPNVNEKVPGVGEQTGTTWAANTELHKEIKSVPEEDSDNDELTHKDMQTGIQKIEGMAQVWPKWALYFTYAW
jgi:hypothetical protein